MNAPTFVVLVLRTVVFKDNTVISGGGGAVYIHSTGSVLNDAEYPTEAILKFHYNGRSSEKLPQINITRCDFKQRQTVHFGGGALCINAVKASVRLCLLYLYKL